MCSTDFHPCINFMLTSWCLGTPAAPGICYVHIILILNFHLQIMLIIMKQMIISWFFIEALRSYIQPCEWHTQPGLLPVNLILCIYVFILFWEDLNIKFVKDCGIHRPLRKWEAPWLVHVKFIELEPCLGQLPCFVALSGKTKHLLQASPLRLGSSIWKIYFGQFPDNLSFIYESYEVYLHRTAVGQYPEIDLPQSWYFCSHHTGLADWDRNPHPWNQIEFILKLSDR